MIYTCTNICKEGRKKYVLFGEKDTFSKVQEKFFSHFHNSSQILYVSLVSTETHHAKIQLNSDTVILLY